MPKIVCVPWTRASKNICVSPSTRANCSACWTTWLSCPLRGCPRRTRRAPASRGRRSGEQNQQQPGARAATRATDRACGAGHAGTGSDQTGAYLIRAIVGLALIVRAALFTHGQELGARAHAAAVFTRRAIGVTGAAAATQLAARVARAQAALVGIHARSVAGSETALAVDRIADRGLADDATDVCG